MKKYKLNSKRIKLLIGCLLFVIASLFGSLAEAAVFPKPSNDLYVYDETGKLSQTTKDFIIATNKEYETMEEQPQIAVVLVDTLDDLTVDEYAVGLFNKWQIGNETHDNGCLLLLAPDEGKIRIEVGYGLEDRLTDGLTGGILDKYLPLLKEKKFDQAIAEIFTAIVVNVNQQYHYDDFQALSNQGVNSERYKNIKEVEPKSESHVAVVRPILSIISAFLSEFAPFLFFMIIGLLFGGSGGSSGGSSDHGGSWGGGSSGSSGGSSGGGSSFGGGSSGGGGSSRSF